MKMTKPQLISASILAVLKIKISVKKTVKTTVSNRKRTVISNDEISENRKDFNGLLAMLIHVFVTYSFNRFEVFIPYFFT